MTIEDLKERLDDVIGHNDDELSPTFMNLLILVQDIITYLDMKENTP